MSATTLSSDRASTGWKVTYSSLLTGLLAFFLLMIMKAENEATTTYKFADRMKDDIYKKLVIEKKKQSLDWLYVEHAGPKGIKLLIPSEIAGRTFFQSGDDQITANFNPYLNTVARIVSELELEQIPTRHQTVIRRLRESGKAIKINVRIEGHSDAVPLGRSSRFRDNWDLSTARAYQVMRYFMAQTPIPDSYFSVSGYGPFHPLVDERNYDENRRVEIYLDIQMIEYENGYHVG